MAGAQYRAMTAALRSDPAQYRDPVVAGFYSDPSAIHVGDDFYLVKQ